MVGDKVPGIGVDTVLHATTDSRIRIVENAASVRLICAGSGLFCCTRLTKVVANRLACLKLKNVKPVSTRPGDWPCIWAILKGGSTISPER